MIFDTHAHYDDHRYDEDREALLASLPSHHIARVVNVSADMESLYTTVELMKKIEFIYAALGVHPQGADTFSDEDLQKIRALAIQYDYRKMTADFSRGEKGVLANGESDSIRENKVVAIGEIGLDYYEDTDNKPLQKACFEKQLALSKELSLPVIIHSRDAAEDTYDILKNAGLSDGQAVVHCFSYSTEMAERFLELGFYIGLGGVVTFKNGKRAKEVAAMVPENRLLLETDCPYLSPDPHRGERNDSRNLSYVCRAIAEYRGTSPEDIERITWENANRFYRI